MRVPDWKAACEPMVKTPLKVDLGLNVCLYELGVVLPEDLWVCLQYETYYLGSI